MAIPNLLMLHFAGTNVQVWTTIAGALDTQIGSDVSALDVVIIENTIKAHNRVVEFKGARYCIGKTASASTVSVCEEDTGGSGNWGSVYASAADAESTGRDHSGLYIIHDGTDQLLCFSYHQDGTTNLRIAKSNDGVTWDAEASIDSGIVAHRGLGIVFQNKIWLAQAGVDFAQIDPVAGSVTVYTVSDSGATGTLVVFRDTLYLIRRFGDSLVIEEFTGSGFSSNTTIHDSGAGWVLDSRGQNAAWVTDSVIHVIGVGGRLSGGATNGQGSHYYTLTPTGSTFSVQNLTTTVIPSGLRPDRANKTGDKWYVHTSTDNDPTVPEYYLFHVAHDDTTTGDWTVFQFTTNAAELTSVALASLRTHSSSSCLSEAVGRKLCRRELRGGFRHNCRRSVGRHHRF